MAGSVYSIENTKNLVQWNASLSMIVTLVDPISDEGAMEIVSVKTSPTFLTLCQTNNIMHAAMKVKGEGLVMHAALL